MIRHPKTVTVIVAACLLTPRVSPYVAHRWFDPSVRSVRESRDQMVVLFPLLGYRTLRGKTGHAAIPVAAFTALASCRICGNNVDLHLS